MKRTKLLQGVLVFIFALSFSIVQAQSEGKSKANGEKPSETLLTEGQSENANQTNTKIANQFSGVKELTPQLKAAYVQEINSIIGDIDNKLQGNLTNTKRQAYLLAKQALEAKRSIYQD
ncbi:MAG: hypothetical protein AAF849_15375 [Bacteroidota bacterium]